MSSIGKEYLIVAIKQLKHLKERAEKGIQQLSDEELHWKPSEESNNIAVIMQHISGNMSSRWLDFLTTDGEKAFRDRDSEFLDQSHTRAKLMEDWEGGWKLLFQTLYSIKDDDLMKQVTLRQQPLSVMQAIQTEIAHISYHVGQILFLGKQIRDRSWQILSIQKNGSKEFNRVVSFENHNND
ncbi:DUF1572 family protein [Sutcliffiella halmapala]|uniref:DUF1572 family protein n=1 Tax=Sutcliffiella halmapala TaxID=79882 RepID=UPI0009951888|nr:DUF1572 family protein [Sutcliffiella halmapala]